MEQQSTFTFGPIQTKWLESLEQHPERQLTERLGRKYDDGTYQACCLGELGLIAGLCKWDGIYLSTKYVNDMGELPDIYEELGLHNKVGDSLDQSKLSLAELNDGGNTWPEIASIIRANPTNYLSKSV